MLTLITVGKQKSYTQFEDFVSRSTDVKHVIVKDVRDTDTMTDEHHTTLGQLLGYSDEAIRHFVIIDPD